MITHPAEIITRKAASLGLDLVALATAMPGCVTDNLRTLYLYSTDRSGLVMVERRFFSRISVALGGTEEEWFALHNRHLRHIAQKN